MKKLSASELVRMSLSRAKRLRTLNVFTSLREEEVLREAEEAEIRIRVNDLIVKFI
jgi:Asp-tRNA(Asn)/Glu-tRNA(Gln) amidotransferase A subunit family amidase